MPEFTPLQDAILTIIKAEIAKSLVDGQCELTDTKFLELLKKMGYEPHRNSVGGAIDALKRKGYINKTTTAHVGRGFVRTITLAK